MTTDISNTEGFLLPVSCKTKLSNGMAQHHVIVITDINYVIIDINHVTADMKRRLYCICAAQMHACANEKHVHFTLCNRSKSSFFFKQTAKKKDLF